MLSMANILAPVVFSERCAWAASYAAQLAREFGSQLVFLYVDQARDEKTLRDFAAREVGVLGTDVSYRCVILDGDPADGIIRYARESQADLIVMPTYHARYRTFLIGSVTAKVLHDVECPVLTGVHHYGNSHPIPDKIRSILCALDDAAGCVPLYRWACDFARCLGAELRFVHALPAVDETSENCGEIEVRRYFLNKAGEQFKAHFAEQAERPIVDLRGGDIAKVIREAALETQADLVVIGRGHANRPMGRLRTVTYNIIRNSPCPVISV